MTITYTTERAETARCTLPKNPVWAGSIESSTGVEVTAVFYRPKKAQWIVKAYSCWAVDGGAAQGSYYYEPSDEQLAQIRKLVDDVDEFANDLEKECRERFQAPAPHPVNVEYVRKLVDATGACTDAVAAVIKVSGSTVRRWVTERESKRVEAPWASVELLRRLFIEDADAFVTDAAE